MRIETHPLDADRWQDLVTLFGDRGGQEGCWCMFWRLSSSDFQRGAGAKNRRALHRLAKGKCAPGVLAYLHLQPVGWCAVAPREEFGRLQRSRTLRQIDDKAVWSIVCFFVDRHHRRSNVASALLRAAVDHAFANGAQIVEGYPLDPRKDERIGNSFAYTGVTKMFEGQGFRVAARRGRKIIMRIERTDAAIPER